MYKNDAHIFGSCPTLILTNVGGKKHYFLPTEKAICISASLNVSQREVFLQWFSGLLQFDNLLLFFCRCTMWTSVVPSSPDAKVPTSRSKHASVLHGPNLYLLGGRNGNVPLKDFWKYHIGKQDKPSFYGIPMLLFMLSEFMLYILRNSLLIQG